MSTAQQTANLVIVVATTNMQFVTDLLVHGLVNARDSHGSGHKQQRVTWCAIVGEPGGELNVMLHVAADAQFTANVRAKMKVYIARYPGCEARNQQHVISVEELTP